MPSDHEMISTEKHELNYVLKKFGKRQTEENREILIEIIQEWKDDDDYSPHNRESFYDYFDDDEILEELEDRGEDDEDDDEEE